MCSGGRDVRAAEAAAAVLVTVCERSAEQMQPIESWLVECLHHMPRLAPHVVHLLSRAACGVVD